MMDFKYRSVFLQVKEGHVKEHGQDVNWGYTNIGPISFPHSSVSGCHEA